MYFEEAAEKRVVERSEFVSFCGLEPDRHLRTLGDCFAPNPQGQRLAREASKHLPRDAFGQHLRFREDRGSAAGVEKDHIC